jgi:O-Antigen ligase
LSTTTYLALFFVVIAYLKNFFIKRPVLSVFILLLVVSLSLVLYSRLDFLNNKINKQIEYSNKGVPGESRFNSFLADMKQMSDHPLIGTGRNIEMKFGKNFFNIDPRAIHRNNGVGVLLGTYGIPFFLFFFFLIWRTFYTLLQSKTNAWLAVILLWIIGFSEDYFFKTFFIALAIYTGIVPRISRTRMVARSGKMQMGKKTLIHE